MEILLSTVDATLGERLAERLREVGHTVGQWRSGTEVPREASLLVIEGLDDVVAAHDAPCDVLALVEESELRLFPECPREISDFCVKPINLAEVVARVQAIAARPPWRERIQQRLLAVAVESAGDLIEITSPDAVVEYVNPAYERVLGVPSERAIGNDPAHFEPTGEQSPALLREIEDTLARGGKWNGIIVSRTTDGRLVHFESAISAVASPKGEVTHRLAVMRDITERLARQEALLEANRALSEARDAAVAASRAKSDFLANMSHELRTPLNAIIGYSEMLLEDFTHDETVAKDLTRIKSAGTHLLSLINDVLDISKIEAEKVELSPDWFDLAELVEQTVATTQPLAQKNHNRLTMELAPDLGRVHADRTRLRQVLLNLLSNACKFTKDGSVVVSVRRFDDGGDRWFELEVRDTGIGISPEHQHKLFHPFVQADSSTTREFGGTGLGLAICKRLVEKMGGTISLTSAVGVGTTIGVKLPVSFLEPASSDAPVSLMPPQPLADDAPTVLLIDDDPAVRDLFTRQLAKRGFHTRVAATGREGLSLAATIKPHAIVLDVKMPGLTGWEVLSALKLSAVTSNIPVIMLTVMQQREVGQALGAVDYLMKPIDPLLLTETLRRHTGHDAAHVLVVEDDEPTRELVRRTLEAKGLRVTEAEHGQAALDVLREAAPDVVVLDLMMPVMDGFTFLHHLRADPRHRRLPVIVATARTLTAQEREELEHAVQRLIEKNAFSRRDLLDAIGAEIDHLVAARKSTPP